MCPDHRSHRDIRDTLSFLPSVFAAADPTSTGSQLRAVMSRALANPDLGDLLPPVSEILGVLLPAVLNPAKTAISDAMVPHAIRCCTHCAGAGNPDMVALYLLRIAALQHHLDAYALLTAPSFGGGNS